MAEPTLRPRLEHVDAMRGVAILTMIVDHLLVAVDEPSHWLRYTVTRLSLPLFVGAAVMVYRGSMGARRARVLAGLVVTETLLNPLLDLGTPGPVTLIAGCLLLISTDWGRAHLGPLAGVGLLQALYVPVPWSGYQPGLVLAWCVLGPVLIGSVRTWPVRWPGWVRAMGRHPSGWYAAHLAVLAVFFR